VSDAFAAAFRARAGPAGELRFDEFVALALYGREVGYYRRDRLRVGYARGTDFFTAATSGPAFGELVAAACAQLLGGRPPAQFTFVEIGAESAGGVLEGVRHPFGAARTVRLGEPIELRGSCVVFSNELFDAQPFRRWIFRRGSWREIAVRLEGRELAEVEWGPIGDPELELPAAAAEGYVIDASVPAMALADAIAGQEWTGVFVACDYGKSWRELTEECPAGTARAYHRHRQSNDLLARPGEQDLTCHVCWDWIAGVLRGRGWTAAPVQSQEAFFVHHAGEYLARVTAAEAGAFSPRKRALAQLLHPGHLGQKFQVLHATHFLLA